MSHKNIMRAVALVSISALLAGCGGAATGGSATGALPPNPGKAPNNATATFIVKVPAASVSPSSRNAKFITSNVKSIDFTVTQTANPANSAYVFYPLTPTSPNCTSGSSGLTCVLQVAAAPGNDTFVVNLYDAVEPGQGFIVATGNIVQAISAQVSNTISITTNGVPSWAVLGFGNPYPATGAATSTPITLQVTDPDGNIIVGSFDMPLTLSDSDTSGAISFSKTSLAQTSDASGLTLNYTGAALTHYATISVVSTSPSLASRYGNPSPTIAQALYAPGLPGPILSPSALYFAHANSAAQTVTITGSPGSSAPFALSSGCAQYVNITGSSPTFTITPVASTISTTAPAYFTLGSCTINATDSANPAHNTWLEVIVGI